MKLSKVLDTKSTYRNSLCTNSDLAKETIIPFMKTLKILFLTMEVKDLCTEKYKTLMKEIKRTQINRKIFLVHGLREYCKNMHST